MKTIKLFAFAAMALPLSLVACKDEEPAVPGQIVQRGDNACRIESFVITLEDDSELIGDVYDYDKSIDVLYDITQVAGLRTATATATLSEGATISPDPSAVRDYMQPVSFTVTAKDGKTARTYTTKASERIVNTYTKVSKLGGKTTTELGVGATTSLGISGTNIVIGTKVFDGRTFVSIGNLNMTGTTGQIVYQTNDSAGHLIASVTSDGAAGTTPVTIYIWKDGYANAPEILLGPSESLIADCLSVGGDLTSGTALLTAVGGDAATGPHFCWEFVDGVRGNYYGLTTGVENGTDNGWGQMISACTGDMAGQWFMWDAPGNSNGGTAAGHVIAGWSGWSGSGNPPGIQYFTGPVPESGNNGWGNLRVGSVRAFFFNETSYAALITKNWPGTFTSIIDAAGNILLNPNDTFYDAATAGDKPKPVAAFILNTSDNCGYLYTFESEFRLVAYKLEIALE